MTQFIAPQCVVLLLLLTRVCCILGKGGTASCQMLSDKQGKTFNWHLCPSHDRGKLIITWHSRPRVLHLSGFLHTELLSKASKKMQLFKQLIFTFCDLSHCVYFTHTKNHQLAYRKYKVLLGRQTALQPNPFPNGMLWQCQQTCCLSKPLLHSALFTAGAYCWKEEWKKAVTAKYAL